VDLLDKVNMYLLLCFPRVREGFHASQKKSNAHADRMDDDDDDDEP
jgi:hypothetical protein